MAEKESPNYFIGKETGYSLIDGVYHIAPGYCIAFEEIADQRAGVDQLVESVTKHTTTIYKEIAVKNRKLWQRIYDDLGLDKEMPYSYKEGTIQKTEAKE